jgi:hypothetical protein
MSTLHTRTAPTAATSQSRAINQGHEGWALVGRLAVLLPLALTVLLIAFGWPAVRSAPHEIPVGLAGSAPVVAQTEQGLTRAAGDAVRPTRYADEASLRRGIANREVYGGIVLAPSGPTLLVASAASPVVAQALTTMGRELVARQGATLATRDVVPLPAKDPRGAGLAAAALPLTLGGVLPAFVAVQLLRRRLDLRVASALAVSVVGGAALAAVLRFWFGSVPLNYGAVALGLSLGMAATAVALVGLAAVFGRLGLGLGAAVVLLLGNPLSGLASAPELLPAGWGPLGQLLPPGASATLLRSTAYFGGAAATEPVVVLSAWVAAGLALCAVAVVLKRRAVPA